MIKEFIRDNVKSSTKSVGGWRRGPMTYLTWCVSNANIMDFKHIINNKVIWCTSKTIPCPIKILWNVNAFVVVCCLLFVYLLFFSLRFFSSFFFLSFRFYWITPLHPVPSFPFPIIWYYPDMHVIYIYIYRASALHLPSFPSSSISNFHIYWRLVNSLEQHSTYLNSLPLLLMDVFVTFLIIIIK